MTSLAEVTSATSVFDGQRRSLTDFSIQAAYWSDGSVITIRVPEGAIDDYVVYFCLASTTTSKGVLRTLGQSNLTDPIEVPSRTFPRRCSIDYFDVDL